MSDIIEDENGEEIHEINNFIDNVEYMFTERKAFYKRIIEKRYEILKEVYENIK